MNWVKKGQIFDPSKRFDWMQSYAQLPTPILLGNVLRIFFCSRSKPDARGQYVSRVSFIDVNPENPKEVLYVHDQPVFSEGTPGSFDAFGVMPGCIRPTGVKNQLEMYYTGWTRRCDVPFCTQIGYALSDDGGQNFYRPSVGPKMGLSSADPYLINGPFLLKYAGMLHMWYASGKQWIKTDKQFEIVYQIKHAKSKNGTNWETEKNFCVPAILANEAQNRPVITQKGDTYYMWFCYRQALDFRDKEGTGYRLGYATSNDLIHWQRTESINGLQLSKEGWDSKMMAYPYMIEVKQKRYLFYNGNYFGKNGFGYAELKGT